MKLLGPLTNFTVSTELHSLKSTKMHSFLQTIDGSRVNHPELKRSLLPEEAEFKWESINLLP